jgi:hypothetical protein
MSIKNITTLKDLKNDYILNMSLFLDENWNNIPKSFVEKISDFVDSLLIEQSFLTDSFVSDFVLGDINYFENLDNLSVEDMHKAVKLENFKVNLKKSVQEINFLKDNFEWDKLLNKVYSFAKKEFSKETLNKMSAKPKDVSRYRGLEVSGSASGIIMFDFTYLISNKAINEYYDYQYVEHYKQLLSLMYRYKVAAFSDIQAYNFRQHKKSSDKNVIFGNVLKSKIN